MFDNCWKGLLFAALLLVISPFPCSAVLAEPQLSGNPGSLLMPHPTPVAVSSANNLPQAAKAKFKADEILIKFKPTVHADKKEKLHNKHGSTKVREFKSLDLHHVKLRKGLAIEEAIKLYAAEADVLYAEPNYLYQALAMPNDLRFSELWGMRNTGLTGGTSDLDIQASLAWDITTGDRNVVVAVIDTGIDQTHPDLAANIWVNTGEVAANIVDDDGNGYVDDLYGIDTFNHDSSPFDDHGHGTHVAGTIGAVGNNGLGVAGINWNVQLLACKFLGANGSGDTAGAIECLDYIRNLKNRGVNIVATNNSWGGGAYSQALYDAINAQRDILFIAAAGNDASDADSSAHYPSGYNLPNIVAVAATDHNDTKAAFSNYGRRSVHLAAPGVKILSTIPRQNGLEATGEYTLLSGTSMAAPHVTGAAALLKAQNPSRDWSAIKNLLLAGGATAANMYERTITGKRLDAYGSLTCSGKSAFSVLQLPAQITVGTPVTLSALSINCAAPLGPVTVKLASGGTIMLADNGIAPDLAAGDGIFTATWTPALAEEVLTFSSPAGSETIEYPALSFAAAAMTSGSLNIPYLQAIFSSGGHAPYVWSIIAGALPPGLSLNNTTGEMTGIPASLGIFSFTVQLTDAHGATVLKDFSICIKPSTLNESWRRFTESNAAIITFEYGSGKINDVAVDSSGNVYVTRVGYIRDEQQVSRSCFFLAKYDPSGSEVWSRTYREGISTQSWGMTLDKDDNIYLAGESSLDGTAFDALLVKFDPAGNLLWSRRYDKAADDRAYDVASDGSGNIYITGWNVNGIFMVKYDATGALAWETTTANVGEKQLIGDPFGITVDAAGNVYVAGFFMDRTPTYRRNAEMLLIKYDSSGRQEWLRTFNDGGNEKAEDVAVDMDGNVYIVGWSIGASPYLILVKYDPAGTILWTERYTETLARGVGLALDISGNVYVTGTSQGTPYSALDFLVLKYGPNGKRLWAMTIDEGYDELGERLAIGPTGELLITGSAYGWGYAMTVKYQEDVPFAFITSEIPAGIRGAAYAMPLSVAGGAGPFAWSLASGNLPPGLSLEEVTTPYAHLLGTPSAIGTYTFVVQCRDANGTTITQQLEMRVTDAMFTLSFPGSGSGKADLSTGQSCVGDCNSSFPAGTGITLTAVPDVGSFFSGWEGACTGTGPCMLTISGDTRVSALFSPESMRFTSMALGGMHTIALRSDGSLWAWGYNTYGPFGDGTTQNSTTPVRIQSVTGIAVVAAGYGHTVLLKQDGSVWTTGYNDSGQIGDGTTGGSHLLPHVVPGLTGATAIAAGNNTTAAVKSNGTVWMWGDNTNGKLGDGTTTARPAPVQAVDLIGAVTVVPGDYHTLALRTDGSVWAWGENYSGQLGDKTWNNQLIPQKVPDLANVISITAGSNHSVALTSDGRVWTWGGNFMGQLGDGTTTTRWAPYQVSGLTNIIAIAAGPLHTLALKADGTVWTWGYNSIGQLGDGTTETRLAPVQVPNLTNVVKIFAGSYRSAAITAAGEIWSWGENGLGAIGDGTTFERHSPTRAATDVSRPATTSYPPEGTYATAQRITLTCSEAATIYYTLNGAEPTIDSPVYRSPLTISSTATLKYFAMDAAGNREATSTQTYVLPECRVKIDTVCSTRINDSINSIVGDAEILQLRGMSFAEGIDLALPFQLTIKGGYAADFGDRAYESVITNLTIIDGTLTVDQVTIK